MSEYQKPGSDMLLNRNRAEDTESIHTEAFYTCNPLCYPCNKHPIFCSRCCFVFLGIFLFFFATQFFWLPDLIEEILHTGIKDGLIFTYPQPHSSSYRSWESNTGSDGVPVWMEYRFFNVTNPTDILVNGSIPHLVLSKPIVYNEYQNKKDISFSNDGTQVTYTMHLSYTHNPERSELNLTDYFVIFSPFVSTMVHLHESGLVEKEVLKQVFKWMDEHPYVLFWNDTVYNILFNLLTIDIPINIDKLEAQGKSVFTGKAKTRNLIKSRVGLYDSHTSVVKINDGSGSNGNGTYFRYQFGGFLSNNTNYTEVLHTGYGDSKRMGEVFTYQNSCYIDCWDPVLSINNHLVLTASHDDFFGVFNPNLKAGIATWVYNLQIVFYMNYNETVDYFKNKLYKYTLNIVPQFDNTTLYPPNSQWYSYGPSGVLNLTKCSEDVTIFISLPMFLGAPDYEANNTKLGLANLNWTEQTYINVEPMTGVIFEANKSLQMSTPIYNVSSDMIHILDVNELNVRSGGNSSNSSGGSNNTINAINTTLINFASLSNIPNDMMMPFVEICECEAFTEHQANQFYDEMNGAKTLVKVFKIVGYVFIPLFILYTWYIWYWLGQRKEKEE